MLPPLRDILLFSLATAAMIRKAYVFRLAFAHGNADDAGRVSDARSLLKMFSGRAGQPHSLSVSSLPRIIAGIALSLTFLDEFSASSTRLLCSIYRQRRSARINTSIKGDSPDDSE